jgi:hypothetical protein
MPLQIQRLIEIGDTLSTMFFNLNENSTRHVLSDLVGSRSDSQENRGAILYFFFILFINNKYSRGEVRPSPDDPLLTFMKVIIYIYIDARKGKHHLPSLMYPLILNFNPHRLILFFYFLKVILKKIIIFIFL